MQESIQRLTQAVDYVLREQKAYHEYYQQGQVLAENVVDACGHLYEVLKEELMRPEVIAEKVWDAEIVKYPETKRRVILLTMSDPESTHLCLLREYTKAEKLWWDYNTHRINDKPEVFMNQNKVYFGAQIPWEEQIAFLKSKGYRINTALGWKYPKGVKKLLKQLDEEFK